MAAGERGVAQGPGGDRRRRTSGSGAPGRWSAARSTNASLRNRNSDDGAITPCRPARVPRIVVSRGRSSPTAKSGIASDGRLAATSLSSTSSYGSR